MVVEKLTCISLKNCKTTSEVGKELLTPLESSKLQFLNVSIKILKPHKSEVFFKEISREIKFSKMFSYASSNCPGQSFTRAITQFLICFKRSRCGESFGFQTVFL